jgi:hypothetical protein
LAGFKSPCTTRRECRCASPAATWCAADRRHASGGGGPSPRAARCSTTCSDSCRRAITMPYFAREDAVVETAKPNTRTTWSCARRAWSAASDSSAATAPGGSAASAWSCFTATGVKRFKWAAFTAPKEPGLPSNTNSPSSLSRSKSSSDQGMINPRARAAGAGGAAGGAGASAAGAGTGGAGAASAAGGAGASAAGGASAASAGASAAGAGSAGAASINGGGRATETLPSSRGNSHTVQ